MWRAPFFLHFVALAVLPAHAQQQQLARTPIETSFVASLDSSRVKPGATFLLRLIAPWQSPACTMREGSVLEGHIVSVTPRSKIVKTAELQLAITLAECSNHKRLEQDFELVALVAAANDDSGQDNQESTSLASAPVALMDSGANHGAGMRAVTAASDYNNSSAPQTATLPKSILPGQVIGLHGVSLGVGAGGAAILHNSKADVRIDRGTFAILLPAASHPNPVITPPVLANRNEPKPPAASSPGTASPPPEEAIDKTNLCFDTCHIAVETNLASRLAATLPIRQLGYGAHEQGEFTHFNEEAVLAYIGGNRLLCAFDLHGLRMRGTPGEEPTRTVRFLLLDSTTYAVKRILDQPVKGDRQYLWLLAGNRIAVHTGHSLSILDANLNRIRSLPVEEHVLWVVSSPTGDHIAVGTLQERHNAEIRKLLAENQIGEPEEDTTIKVYDALFALVSESARSSKVPLPVLSDAGELRVHALKPGHWQILESKWDHTEHTVTKLDSPCKPVLSAPSSGLIFAVGCKPLIGHWYRVLHDDGHTILRGDANSDEVEQALVPGGDGAFAVRTIKTRIAVAAGSALTREAIKQEVVTVYDQHGVAKHHIATADFALATRSFTLKDDNNTVAVLGDGDIQFYNWIPESAKQ